MNQRTMARAFLVLCGVSLIPVALSYGAAPSVTMEALYGIGIDEVGQTHVMRVTMCLYLGMAFLWLAGALQPSLTGAALIACCVFMLSIAAGRLLSFAADGVPHWVFIAFTVLEVVGGLLALALYRRGQTDNA